jgi:chromosome segregation ATPase
MAEAVSWKEWTKAQGWTSVEESPLDAMTDQYVEQLMGYIKKLEAENSSLKKELEESNYSSQNELDDANNLVGELKEDKKGLEQTIVELVGKVHSLEEEQVATDDELDDTKSLVEELQAQIEALKHKWDFEHDAYENAMSALKKANQEKYTAQEQAKLAQKLASEYQIMVKEIPANDKKLYHEMKIAQDQAKSYLGTLDIWKEELAQKDTQIAALKSALQDAKAVNPSAGKIAQLEAQITEYQNEIDHLKKVIKSLDQHVGTHQKQFTVIAKQLDGANENNKILGTSYEKKVVELNTVKENHEILKHELSEISTSYNNLWNQYEELDARMKMLFQQVHDTWKIGPLTAHEWLSLRRVHVGDIFEELLIKHGTSGDAKFIVEVRDHIFTFLRSGELAAPQALGFVMLKLFKKFPDAMKDPRLLKLYDYYTPSVPENWLKKIEETTDAKDQL